MARLTIGIQIAHEEFRLTDELPHRCKDGCFQILQEGKMDFEVLSVTTMMQSSELYTALFCGLRKSGQYSAIGHFDFHIGGGSSSLLSGHITAPS